MIQIWSALTDQLQALGPATDTAWGPPAKGKFSSSGDTLVGDAGQPTVTGMSWLPILTVPDSPTRPDGTVTVTLSGPDTLDGLTPIQLGLELTGQLHPLSPVTDTCCSPPAAGNVNDVGDTMARHSGSTMTEMVWLPIVTVPDSPA